MSSSADDGWPSPVGRTLLDADPRRFFKWCKRERVWFPAGHIATVPATGRGLVAVEAIQAGDVVVEVPDDAVLRVETCSIADRMEEAELGEDAASPLVEVQALILAVMFERVIGRKSRWCAYLDFLPGPVEGAQAGQPEGEGSDGVSRGGEAGASTTASGGLGDLPMFWTPSELRELEGTATLDKLRGEVQQPMEAPTQVERMFEEVFVPFHRRYPELPFPKRASEQRVLWRWATALVASYAFVLGDDGIQAMVPVWDLLNHVTGRANVRLHHDEERGVLQMIATRGIAAGEELVNDFGELATSELLCSYGFVEQANPHDHAQVPLSVLLQACSAVGQTAAAAAAAAAAPHRSAAASSAGRLDPGAPGDGHPSGTSGRAAAQHPHIDRARASTGSSQAGCSDADATDVAAASGLSAEKSRSAPNAAGHTSKRKRTSDPSDGARDVADGRAGCETRPAVTAAAAAAVATRGGGSCRGCDAGRVHCSDDGGDAGGTGRVLERGTTVSDEMTAGGTTAGRTTTGVTAANRTTAGGTTADDKEVGGTMAGGTAGRTTADRTAIGGTTGCGTTVAGTTACGTMVDGRTGGGTCSIPHLERRLALCRDREWLPPAGGVAVKIPLSGEPPAGLLHALQLLLLGEEELRAYEAALAAWRSPWPLPAPAALAPGVMAVALMAVADQMEARYSTSLDHDQALLSDMTRLPSRHQAALVVRASEKRCLTALKTWAHTVDGSA